MLRLAAIKLFRTALTVLICVSVVFVVLRLSGDPARILLPEGTPTDIIDAYRQRWGLDQPLAEQYLAYLRAVAVGDLGRSFADGREAAGIVAERVPATLQLGVAALVLTLLIGLPMGILAAVYRNRALDRLCMSVAVFGYSMPHFFLGVLLILLFSLTLRMLPTSGSATWAHMVMPVVTLGTAAAGTVARFVRASMLEVMGQPYIRTARGKGLGWWITVSRHALPNAAIPTVTVLGFQVGTLIAGAVVTETVFAWPGVGRLLVTAVAQRDLAVVQTIVLMVAVTMSLTNLGVDLLYGWLDPRLRGGAGR